MKTSYSNPSQAAIAKSSLKKSKSSKHSSSKSSSKTGRKGASSSKSSKRESNDDVATSSSRKSSKGPKLGDGRKAKQAVVTPEKKGKSESLSATKKSKKRSHSSESRKDKSPKKKSAPTKKKYNPVLMPWENSGRLFSSYVTATGAEDDVKVQAELIKMDHREMIHVIANESTPKELLPAICMLAAKLNIPPDSWPNLTSATKKAVVDELVNLSMTLANQ